MLAGVQSLYLFRNDLNHPNHVDANGESGESGVSDASDASVVIDEKCCVNKVVAEVLVGDIVRLRKTVIDCVLGAGSSRQGSESVGIAHGFGAAGVVGGVEVESCSEVGPRNLSEALTRWKRPWCRAELAPVSAKNKLEVIKMAALGSGNNM